MKYFIAFLLATFGMGYSMANGNGTRINENWPEEFEEECGISYTDRIIGGKNASLGQYPWLARIGYKVKGNNQHGCGAVLIHPWYVLTAAHCVYDLGKNIKVNEVVLGEHNALTEIDCEGDVCADPLQIFQIAKITSHSGYNSPVFKHDIALIKLERPAKFTEWVLPICIPSGDLLKTKLIGEIAEVAGWGLTNSDNDRGTSFLQTVKIPIVDIDVCKNHYRDEVQVGPEQLCVGGELGKDSCGGDSGGPLVKALSGPMGPRYYLLGIVSFGAKDCGKEPLPGVYTNVIKYISWIVENMQ